MANVMNDACFSESTGDTFCASLGRCVPPGAPCPQQPFIPSTTLPGCIQDAQARCSEQGNLLAAAACSRGVLAALQPAGVVSTQMVQDVTWFPHATLQGMSAGAQCGQRLV